MRAEVDLSPLQKDRTDTNPSASSNRRSTQEDGKFEFTDLGPGTYALTAAAQGFVAAYAGPVEVEDSQSVTVDLILLTGGVVLRGAVLDADGGPIREARMAADWNQFELATEGSKRVFPFKCDAAGKFLIELLAGRYHLALNADGYAQGDYWLELTTNLQRNFVLERAGTISGRIVAGGEGAGVADAAVELLVTGPYAGRSLEWCDGEEQGRRKTCWSDAKVR